VRVKQICNELYCWETVVAFHFILSKDMVPRWMRDWGWGVCLWYEEDVCFSLGQYTTVLQTEVQAIKSCNVENLWRGYMNRSVYILSDSHAVIKEFDNYQINSKLVCDCNQPLAKTGWTQQSSIHLGARSQGYWRIMKRSINWQDLDMNILLQDLSQHVASQQGLPKWLSGTGQSEATKKYWESITRLNA
jgi:hypothetical protein